MSLNGASRVHFKGNYICRVGGEFYTYDAQYTPGVALRWRADVYQGSKFKTALSGQVEDNTLAGIELQKFLMGNIEAGIEVHRGKQE